MDNRLHQQLEYENEMNNASNYDAARPGQPLCTWTTHVYVRLNSGPPGPWPRSRDQVGGRRPAQLSSQKTERRSDGIPCSGFPDIIASNLGHRSACGWTHWRQWRVERQNECGLLRSISAEV